MLFAAAGVHLIHPLAHGSPRAAEPHALRNSAGAGRRTDVSGDGGHREGERCPVCAFLSNFHTEPLAILSAAVREIPAELTVYRAGARVTFTALVRLPARAPPA